MKEGLLGCVVGGGAAIIGKKLLGNKKEPSRRVRRLANALAGCAVGGGGAILARFPFFCRENLEN